MGAFGIVHWELTSSWLSDIYKVALGRQGSVLVLGSEAGQSSRRDCCFCTSSLNSPPASHRQEGGQHALPSSRDLNIFVETEAEMGRLQQLVYDLSPLALRVV